MKIEKSIQIGDGITLHMIPTNKFKTSFISFSFVKRLDEVDNTKTALLPFVLKGASQKYPDLKKLNEALDELYGASLNPVVRKKGDWQAVGFCMDYISDEYVLNGEQMTKQALDLLTEVVFHPKTDEGGFLQQVVAIEKENLKDSITSLINDKRAYAMQRCVEIMCKGEPVALCEYGQEKDIEVIDRLELNRYYLQMLKTCQIEIYYVGDTNTAQIEEQLKKAFSKVKRTYNQEKMSSTMWTAQKDEQYVVEEFDVNQCKLNLGFRSGIGAEDEDFYALMMTNAVFGGGPNSKLFLNVREKLSLCYYAASRVYKQNGMIIVYSGIEKENEKKAVDEIKKQLEDIRQEKVSDEEFDQAKKGMVNSLKSLNDSAFGTEDFLLGERLSPREKTIEDYIKGIESVTKEQIFKVAKKITPDTIYVLSGKTAAGSTIDGGEHADH